MQGKQAKIVSPSQERAILGYLDTTRYPSRDRVMFLLSMKAGLRAKEMASLTWAMVTDAAGQVAEVLHVPNRVSKGVGKELCNFSDSLFALPQNGGFAQKQT